MNCDYYVVCGFLIVSALFFQLNADNVNLSKGYGCLLKCLSSCLSSDSQDKHMRDCKIECKQSSSDKDCLENDVSCTNICTKTNQSMLAENSDLKTVDLNIKGSEKIQSNPKLIELSWTDINDAILYVVRFKFSNESIWMYQEVPKNSFTFIKPKACVVYEFQVAYLLKNKEIDQIEISPFSKPYISDNTKPTWHKNITSKPTKIFLDKNVNYVDEVTNEILDSWTIFVLYKIDLPLGWYLADFQVIGKYWRVSDCKHYAKTKGSLVTFSKIVEHDHVYYIEARFPSYLGKNNCTVVNQLRTAKVCDKSIQLPFESQSKVNKVMLDCLTVEKLSCGLPIKD